MRFRKPSLYLPVILLFFCAYLTVISAEKNEVENTLTTYLEFRGELSADEIKPLEKALKGKDKVASVNAAWRLAAHFRAKGEFKKAEELIKGYASTRDFETIPKEFAAERLRCILESAHIKSLNKDPNGAMALLSWAEMRKDDFQRAVSCVKYAEILLDMGEFERSESYLKTADGVIGKHLVSNPDGAALGQGSEVVDKSASWRDLKQNADALAREIEFEKLKSKYGVSYALYVKLRRIQTLLKKSFIPRYEKEAMSLINEIITTDPQSQFAAAAEYLKGEIMASKLKEESPKKEIKEVKEYLEKFVSKQPDGLYRGEALMLLGKIALEIEWDAKASEKYYTSALDYFRKAREKRDNLSLYAPMSDGLKKQSAPTQKPTSLNEWKRIVYHDEDPLKLYNSTNAPAWYVNCKEEECMFTLGFFRFADGKYEDALKFFESAGNLNADVVGLERINYPNKLMRLRIACKQGFMITDPLEQKALKKEEKLFVLLGEFLHLEENNSKALSHWRHLQKMPLSSDCIGIAIMAEGDSLRLTPDCDIKYVESLYAKVASGDRFEKLPIHARAMYNLAWITLQSGPSNREKANMLFEECIEKNKESKYAEASMFYLIMINLGRDAQIVDKYTKEYQRQYPKGIYAPRIDQRLKEYEEYVKK